MKSQLQAQVLLWSSFNLSCASGFCFCFLSCCCLVQPSGHEYTIVFVVLPLLRRQVKEAAISRRSSGQTLRYCQPRDTIFKRCPGFAGASPPWRTCLEQLTYEVPGELLVSCLRRTGSTLSPSCITTLFILSLRLSPDIL